MADVTGAADTPAALWLANGMSSSMRVTVRLVEMYLAWQFVPAHRWTLSAAAAAAAGVDVLLPLLRRRSNAMHLLPRLAMDSADAALWTWALSGWPDLTTMIAVPLALGAGIRRGWRGLLVPTIVGTTVWLATPVAALNPILAYMWPTVAAIGGILIGRYLASHRWQEEQTAARHIDAAGSLAELSGQNSVATGADSVADLLASAAPLLAAYETDPAPSPLRGWKQALAAACSGRATYLRVALLCWQSDHNRSSPDLNADVEFDSAADDGTLLLSIHQTAFLRQTLDALQPRGTVPVRVVSSRPPGQRQVFMFGTQQITVPSDPDIRPRPPQPVPLIFVWAASLTLQHSLPFWDAVPLYLTVPTAALLLATGYAFYQIRNPATIRYSSAALAVGLPIGAFDAVTSTAYLTPHSTRMPYLYFLLWLGPMLAYCLPDLPMPRRIGAIALIVAVAAISGAGAPTPPRNIGLSLLWPVLAVIVSYGLGNALRRDTRQRHDDLNRQIQHATHDGYRRGRKLVVDLTTAALLDLQERHAAIRAATPDDVNTELDQRFARAAAALSILT